MKRNQNETKLGLGWKWNDW